MVNGFPRITAFTVHLTELINHSLSQLFSKCSFHQRAPEFLGGIFIGSYIFLIDPLYPSNDQYL